MNRKEFEASEASETEAALRREVMAVQAWEAVRNCRRVGHVRVIRIPNAA